MPFTISHQPDLGAVYGAAFAGGLGQYNERRHAERLAYDKMALDDLQQQRAISASTYAQAASQAFNAQQAAADRRFRQGMAGAQWQAQLGRDLMMRDLEAQDADDREFNLRERMGIEQQHALERQNALFGQQQLLAGEQAFRAAEDDRRAWITDQYDSGVWKLDQGSTRRLQQLRSQMGAIRNAPNLTPQDKQNQLATLDSQYWDILSNPAPTIPGERPKPMSAQVQENSYQEPVQGPNGEFMGYNVWTKNVRNGVEQYVPKFVPYKPEKPDATLGPVKAQKDFDSFVDSFIGKANPAGEGEAKRPYSQEEIWKMWQQRQALQSRFSKAGDPMQQAYEDEKSRLPEFAQKMLPQSYAEAQQMMGQPQQVPPSQAPLQEMPPQAPPQPPVHLDGLRSDDRAMAEKYLPRPRSLQDVMTLPVGTRFIAPDGTIRTR